MSLVEGKKGAQVGKETKGRAQPFSLGGCGLLRRVQLSLLPQQQRLLPCLAEAG